MNVAGHTCNYCSFGIAPVQGWNKSFDEWIEQQGLVPFDAELAKVSLGQDEPAKEKPKRAEKKRKAPELAPWDEQQQDVRLLIPQAKDCLCYLKRLPQSSFRTTVKHAAAVQVQVLLAPLLQKVLLDDKDTIEGGQLHALPSRCVFYSERMFHGCLSCSAKIYPSVSRRQAGFRLGIIRPGRGKLLRCAVLYLMPACCQADSGFPRYVGAW